jgi:hypothetical protein
MSEPENEDGSDSSGVAERGKLAGFWLEAGGVLGNCQYRAVCQRGSDGLLWRARDSVSEMTMHVNGERTTRQGRTIA